MKIKIQNIKTLILDSFRIGYTLPMFFGFVVMFLSTLLFAFGSSFATLWLARALQGVGSACTSTSGIILNYILYNVKQYFIFRDGNVSSIFSK